MGIPAVLQPFEIIPVRLSRTSRIPNVMNDDSLQFFRRQTRSGLVIRCEKLNVNIRTPIIVIRIRLPIGTSSAIPPAGIEDYPEQGEHKHDHTSEKCQAPELCFIHLNLFNNPTFYPINKTGCRQWTAPRINSLHYYMLCTIFRFVLHSV